MTETATPVARQRQTDSKSDEIDLRQLFAQLLDHRWLIILVTALFAILGVLYVITATPVYQADGLLQVEDKKGGMPGFSELNDLFSQDASAEAEIQIIRSRMVLGSVIDQLNMAVQVSPDRAPLFGRFSAPDPALPHLPSPLFAGYRDSETHVAVAHFSVPPGLEGEQFQLREENGQPALYLHGQLVASGPADSVLMSEDAAIQLKLSQWQYGNEPLILVRQPQINVINSLRSSLAVSEQGRGTGIIAISLSGTNRERINAVLSTILETYQMQNIRRMSAEAEQSLDFLDQQLPEIRDDLNAAEERLNAYRLENESVDLTLETKSVLERLVGVEAKLNELKIQESEVASRFTREHPAYRTLMQQRRSLEQEREALNKQIQRLPETQQDVVRMTRDVQVNQEIYVGLLNKVQELRIMRASTVGSVRIIDRAMVNSSPVAPRKALLVVLATMLGGMASVGYVLFRALFNRGIKSPEELEEQGVSVYAAIPLSEHQQKADRLATIKRRRKKDRMAPIPLLAETDPGDLAVEALRSLRTSLHFAMMEADNRVIMISGPSPGVGKSFVSTNLAAVLAQVGQRVLLIDADMRKGHMHRYFANDNTAGLSEWLSGQASQSEAIQHTNVANLDFIPRGQIPPNPSELLMHKRFKQLIDEKGNDYDLVLIDTPPILAVTDAAIVGQLAGTSLIIARYGVNSAKEVDVCLTRFAQNNVEIKGAILNCMERSASNEYGYYAYEYGKIE